MRPRFPFLLLLAFVGFFAVPLFGQGTDFAVTLDGYDRQATLDTTFVVHAFWTGTQPAKDVVLELDVPGDISEIYHWDADTVCITGHPVRCTMPSVAAHDGGFSIRVVFPAAGTYAVTARVTSATPDPNPANNSATRSIFVANLPSLRPYGGVDYTEGNAVDPGGAGKLRVGLQNDGAAATNVVFRARFPEGGTFTSINSYGEDCSIVAPDEMVCHLGAPGRFWSFQIGVNFVAPDESDGRKIPFVVSVDADQDDFDPVDDTSRSDYQLRRLFNVTSPADDGPGSLRQAIVDTAVFCENIPCLIRANDPLVQSLVIQPNTPLPTIRGRVKIDGGAARMTLDGSQLMDGDALRWDNGCELRVDRLVIRNFRGHAIEAHQDPALRCGDNSFLTPVNVTHSELAANLRGVVTKGVSATITDCIIRDHVRAGIFADGGYFDEIARNQITNNGASGIFVNASTGNSYLPPGAEIYGNTISGNREWGIARAAGGSIHIYENSIFGNNLYGIDTGLDLGTPDPTLKPVLISAVYHADIDKTVVRGSVEFSSIYGTPSVDLYASSALSAWGYPEAEKQVGEFYGGSGSGFEIAVPGDLRGKWITATGTKVTGYIFSRRQGESEALGTETEESAAQEFRYQSADTSELSNAIQVQ